MADSNKPSEKRLDVEEILLRAWRLEAETGTKIIGLQAKVAKKFGLTKQRVNKIAHDLRRSG